jgi:hypothetical protein
MEEAQLERSGFCGQRSENRDQRAGFRDQGTARSAPRPILASSFRRKGGKPRTCISANGEFVLYFNKLPLAFEMKARFSLREHEKSGRPTKVRRPLKLS